MTRSATIVLATVLVATGSTWAAISRQGKVCSPSIGTQCLSRGFRRCAFLLRHSTPRMAKTTTETTATSPGSCS
jgi:hypothetical protein